MEWGEHTLNEEQKRMKKGGIVYYLKACESHSYKGIVYLTFDLFHARALLFWNVLNKATNDLSF